MSLTALFTGAAGLQANSFALDVVGNNLANLNTTGYKGQRTLFSDLLYQTISPGSGPSGAQGGTNPMQIGFGVAVGGITSLMSQGSISPTGRSLDAAIQGSGFFVVSNGVTSAYTRAGSFSIDAAGYLVDPNTGYRVQRTGSAGEGTAALPGFQVAGNNDIRVPFGAGAPGTPTAAVSYQGNLSSSLAVGDAATTAIQVYDSQGTARTLTLTFTKTAANTFTAAATVNGATATLGSSQVTFDSSGLLASPASLALNLTGITGAANQTVTLNLGTVGQATGLTQFGGTSTANAVTQDGSGAGTLTSVAFDSSGVLQGLFSNGRTIPLAQLAVAGFNNEAGLIRSGENYFLTSSASGQALVGTAGSGGLGSVEGAALEGSNVDIATEFSRLIIAQRGFQVNARTITAANDTLQELANVIR